ncbi:adhesion G protein-coupled receptor E5 [Echinops telfairi]|uniref:Adhesion G protein-coupled receptor E5 n=1 Tax=Echinops telfairi TaxID=9371 RepID=A0AC55D1P6_ECHTE|nr:adhesion G protein-coupled receptor E5 [Echinops telfairi]
MGGLRPGVFLGLGLLLTLLKVRSQKVNCARWCPPNSTCINATACRCNPGFLPVFGEFITNYMEFCEDINECAPPQQEDCGTFAQCENVEGSYYCMCNPGYELASGGRRFKNSSENTCRDVNECELKPSPCRNTTYCVNSMGSYECSCRRGWRLKPGSPKGLNTTDCEEIGLPSWTWSSEFNHQSLTHFFNNVHTLRRDFKPNSTNKSIQKLITFMDELLTDTKYMEGLDQRYQIATQLLSGLEQMLRALAQTLPGPSFTYRSQDTELSVLVRREDEKDDGDKRVTVGQSRGRVMLQWSVAAPVNDSGPTVVGILSSEKMRDLVDNASLVLELEKVTELETVYESQVHVARVEVLSAVNSIFVSNNNTETLASNVTFTFSYPAKTPAPLQELLCAFWKADHNGSGYWATQGCKTLGSRNNSTTCECEHLSSFAILMAHYKVQDPRLALITKVGLSLSLICLLLCILTFLLVRPIQSSRTTVHLHLCICLFVGSAIFLAGVEKEGAEVGLGCRLVAGLLHYFFLAAFCWMGLEGLELYFLVVRVFQAQGLGTRWLCLLGYGVPGIIVGISAAVNSEGYGRTSYCWLNPEKGFLWSFLGPVCVIILCNSVIFVITVWKLTQKFSEINPDMKKLKQARVLTITAVAQLLVLGCTWVFGLFLFDPNNYILSYIFTILNCLQGLFLFLLHCLLNKKVREEYWKWFSVVTRSKYSEFTSTSASSHQQTQTLRQSESSM